MARSCTICIHPQRDAIDDAIRTAEPHQAIAARFGVTRDSVRRHALSHLGESAPVKRTAIAPSAVTRAVFKRAQGQNIPADERADYQARFLAAFRTHGIITRACDEIGVDRETVRGWEEHDESFSPQYASAKEAVNDIYREAARKRAIDGTESFVVNQGKLVYDPETGQPLIERKYSDALLQFVMKAKMPEFREKPQIDITSNGQTVGQGVTLDQLAALMTRAQQDVRQWQGAAQYDSDDLGPT
jgi:hypothetical protein